MQEMLYNLVIVGIFQLINQAPLRPVFQLIVYYWAIIKLNVGDRIIMANLEINLRQVDLLQLQSNSNKTNL